MQWLGNEAGEEHGSTEEQDLRDLGVKLGELVIKRRSQSCRWENELTLVMEGSRKDTKAKIQRKMLNSRE